MRDDTQPAPPIPAEADLRHFPTMPLHVQRLRDSELAAVPDAEVRWAALMSWCAAWHQVPAGSLPDDDVALCRLLGYGRDLRRWRPLRAKGALRGWFRASDGRLYHPVVVAMALDCLAKSKRQQAAAQSRWAGDRGANQGRIAGDSESIRAADGDETAVIRRGDAASQIDQVTGNTRKPSSRGNAGAASSALPRREGKGREGIESTPSLPFPNGKEREGAPPPDGDGPPPPVSIEQKQAAGVPLSVLQEMCGVWNEMAAAAGIPQVSELNAKRRAAFQARIRERWSKDPVGKFRAYCGVIESLPFCRGENDRGWKANIDWALRPGTPAAVAEGKYGEPEEAQD